MEICIIGYGKIGGMLHKRLAFNNSIEIFIGNKKVEENKEKIRKSDVIFFCLRNDVAEREVSKYKEELKEKIVFTTGLKPWPLDVDESTEQLLLIPSVYGMIGYGRHLIHMIKPLSSKAKEVIKDLEKLGKIEYFQRYEDAVKTGIETGVLPGVLAYQIFKEQCNPEEISEKGLERISEFSGVDKEKIRIQLPLVKELIDYFKDPQKIVKFVATEGGITERIIRQMKTYFH